MRTIWKYTLGHGLTHVHGGTPVVRHVGIDPAGNPLLGDGNLPTVWVELDPDTEPDRITLTFIGTGHDLPGPGWTHVGSCISPAGLVWHVYLAVET